MIIDSARKDFDRYMADTPNIETITIGSVDYEVSTLSGKQTEKKEFKTLLAPHTGIPLAEGVIYSWEGTQWIVLEQEKKPIDSHTKFRTALCTHEISWKNEFDETITHCAFVQGPNNEGHEQVGVDLLQDLDYSQARVVLPYNEQTALLEITDRIMIKNRAWKVSTFDDISRNSLVFLIIEREKREVHTVSDVWKLVSNSGNDISLAAGDTLQLDMSVFKNDRLKDDSISYISSDLAVATVDANGMITAVADGSCVITCEIAESVNITTDINLTIEAVPTANTQYHVEGMDNVIVGDSINLEAFKMDNGIDTGQVLTIEKTDDLTNSLSTLTLDSGNKYVFNTNNDYQLGTVNLRVMEGVVEVYAFSIEITSLW